MEPRYSVVAVHGITGKSGKTQAGFSKDLAKRVMTEPAWEEKFWREAVWEGKCDEFDEKVRKIVSELVNSYSIRECLKQRPGNQRGFSLHLPDVGGWISKFFKRKLSNSISGILDHILDLPLYLGISYGEQIRSVVKEKIDEALKQTSGVVVVGHSLGSVIAYDVVAELLAQSNPPAIQALVTMGSPLDWVTDLRKTQNEITSLPPSLPWVNFYNKVDPVPLKRIIPPTTFPGIKNVEISFGKRNPLDAHSAYWTDETVAKCIRQLVGRNSHCI